MVTENTEPVQAPLIQPDSPTPEPDNPILAEVDRLNGLPEVDISEPVAEPTAPVETPPVTDSTVPQEPTTPVAETPTTPPPAPLPNTQMTPEQIQQMQQQSAQYEQVQQRSQLQQEAQRYQQQLETQGYMPDQAQQLAYQYMQTKGAQMNMMKQHQQQMAEIQGKQAAAEHFARQHGLTFEDMATLRLAETPEQMEQVAKKMSDDRKVRDELSQLRKAQVPPQSFDNSQGAPEVAANDGSWLDRYNAGDRSPNAVAAAKRTLGIE